MIPLAFFGWIPVVVALFFMLPARRAVVVAVMAAWLFLPIATYSLPGFPDYDKTAATLFAVLVSILLFDPSRLATFQPRWYDLPLAVLCLCPFASSLSNGLGVYDGLSATLWSITKWGVPYFIGRIYFNDLEGLRELAIGFFIGGLVYVPLCLYEIKMSPQLHYMVYGFHQHHFAQSYRLGGWRPTVFMQHGLAVGLWMAMATLAGVWLWLTGALKSVATVPISMLVSILCVTTILIKSSGALILMGIGFFALAVFKRQHSSWPIVVVSALTVLYVVLRASGLWEGREMVTATESLFGQDRAGSIKTRVDNEIPLARRARERLMFGWGRWGRSRITSFTGDDNSVTDSLWIITFGTNGIVGLGALLATLLRPPLSLSQRVQPWFWDHPMVSPAPVWALILALWMVDNTLNSMGNPVFVLAAGGLSGLNRVEVEQYLAEAPT